MDILLTALLGLPLLLSLILSVGFLENSSVYFLSLDSDDSAGVFAAISEMSASFFYVSKREFFFPIES